jgi:hypothetical protein
LSRGLEKAFTAGDLMLMDVIGYDPAVPEPGTLVLLAIPVMGLAALCRHLTEHQATRSAIGLGDQASYFSAVSST